MGASDMQFVARWIVQALQNPDDSLLLERLAVEVKQLAVRFPVPGAA